MSNLSSPLLRTMVSCIHHASKDVTRDFDEISYLRSCSSVEKINSFASSSGKRVYSLMKSALREYNRSYGFLTFGESPDHPSYKTSHWWLLYPIYPFCDFAGSLYDFSIGTTLMYGMMPVAACFHFPILCETFFVEKGRGCYMENMKHQTMRARVTPLRKVSECTMISNKLVLSELSNSVLSIRVLKSYITCALHTSVGKYDIFAAYNLSQIEESIVKLILFESNGSFAKKEKLSLFGGDVINDISDKLIL